MALLNLVLRLGKATQYFESLLRETTPPIPVFLIIKITIIFTSSIIPEQYYLL